MVLSNAQYARDGLGVIVFTEQAFMRHKAGTRSYVTRMGSVKTRQRQDNVCVCMYRMYVFN